MKGKSSVDILVVDDEAQIADMIAEFLRGEGYTVEVAYDSTSAVGMRISWGAGWRSRSWPRRRPEPDSNTIQLKELRGGGVWGGAASPETSLPGGFAVRQSGKKGFLEGLRPSKPPTSAR